jgi:galacturan 1,4-alpha-galacturonidase
MDHGAKGDGVADDKAAFEAAVAAARGVKRAVVLLPAGHTFLLSPIALVEETNLEIRIDGVVRAPMMERWPRPPQEDASLSAERQRMRYAFLELRYCRSLVISGSGAIEGRGQPWWRRRKRRPEIRAPALLVIRESSDCVVRYLSLVESPFYHVVVLDSERIKLDRLRVATPSGSVNTDGIDVLASSDVTISKCHVSTGDDNVAIKEGSRRVQVLGGLFHKGHGLSIGSLGERHTEQSVEDVLLANVRFYRTSNAARVKTWQGGRGRVRNVTFSNETDAVAVSDVTVSGLTGWHTSGVAAMLHCSQSTPCGVVATGIDVRSVPGCSNVVRCLNVASRPGAACADGDNMHGYRLDLSRRQRRALARNGTSCVHPP